MRKWCIGIGLGATISLAAQPAIDWQRSLGGSGDDRAYAIAHTNDGGFIVVGESNSTDGDVTNIHGTSIPPNRDAWVVRLDADGNLVWQRALGGAGYERGNDVDATADGGYIITCYTDSSNGDVSATIGGGDIWLVKLDDSGNILWDRTFGGTASEAPEATEVLPNGDLLVTAVTNSTDGDMLGCVGATDFWLGRFSPTGDLLWHRCYGGSGIDRPYDLSVFPDGSVVMVGFTRSTDGDVTGIHGPATNPEPDAWLVKTDTNGDLEWERCLGGTDIDVGWAVEATPNGKIYVATAARSLDGDIGTPLGQDDFWITRFDVGGNLELESSFGGTSHDASYAMTFNSENEIIVIGSSVSNDGHVSNNHGSSDLWLIKLSQDLELLWERSFGGSLADTPSDVCTNENGSIAFVGYSRSSDGDLTVNHGVTDYWVVKLEAETVDIAAGSMAPFSLFPNPASNTVSINLHNLVADHLLIVDVTGRIVHSERLPSGITSWVVHIGELAQGAYDLRLQTADQAHSVRFIKY